MHWDYVLAGIAGYFGGKLAEALLMMWRMMRK